MNTKDFSEFAFRMLNYVNGSYQGRFAQLNIMAKTEHPRFKTAFVDETRRVLQRVHHLFDEYWSGNFILATDGRPASPAAKETLELLVALKPELNSIAQEGKRILLAPDFHVRPEDVAMLIALFGRTIYSGDNAARQILDYAQRIGDEGLLYNANEMVASLQDSLKQVSEFIRIYHEPKENYPNYFDQLRFDCRLVPAVYRGYVHEIYQFENGPVQQLGFSKAGFMAVEAQAWMAIGMNAVEAGYWRAFDFSTDEVLMWKGIGVFDPAVAAEWESAGFEAGLAKGWIEVLFPPLLAIQWLNAGYAPKEAGILVSQGFSSPIDIPEGKAEELILAGADRYQRAREGES